MRYYSTTAGEMVLQGGVAAGDTSIVVDTTAGLPSSFPYTLILDYGESVEEVVTVTNAASTTLTVTRGEDGTVAQAHAFGAVIRHGVTARDYREAREHEDATTGVHGVTGAVVGTTDTQTLTNKTITGGDADFDTLQRAGNDALITTFTQVVTNKDLTSATNTFPSSLATDAELAAHAADTSSHGTTGAIVGTTDTQTLTGKTMSGASNTFSAIPQSAVTSLTTDLGALDTRLDTLEARPRVVTGTVTVDISAATSATDSVNFGTEFASAPNVMATVNSAPGGATGATLRVSGITTTGCVIYTDVPTSRTVSMTVAWVAVL